MRAYKALCICLLLTPFVALEDTHSYDVDLSDFEDDTDEEFDEGYGPTDEALYNESEEDRYLDEFDRAGGKKKMNMKKPGSCTGKCDVMFVGEQWKTLKHGESFTMCSGNYPKKYPKGDKSCVDVEAPSFTWLKVTFCYFNVVYSSMCKGDRLVVLDRAMSSSGVDPPCENKYQRARRFCNIQHKRVYYVKTPNARFKFQTNKDRYIRKGFKIHVQAIKSPCALELMPPKGVIRVTHTRGEMYHSNYYCNWVYNYGHTENEAFQLTCPKFYVSKGVKHMQSSPDCVHVVSSNGSEYSYTGKNGPEYLSHGGNVTLEFFANRRHHSKGFTCQYQINPPGELNGLCIHAKNCNSTRLSCDGGICKCNGNYTEVKVGAKEYCAVPVMLGQMGCQSDADCTLGEANAMCDTGKCVCKSGFVELSGQCVTHKKLGETCIDSSQCALTAHAGTCGSKGTCVCDSGYSTARGCGGSKYTGCYPMLIVDKGTTYKEMPMPVAHNTKFCIYNFVSGYIQFFSPTLKKAIKYAFQKFKTRNRKHKNLFVWRQFNGAWKKAHMKRYNLNGNPDYFWLIRSADGKNQVLKTGTGGKITENVPVGPPVQWQTVALHVPKQKSHCYAIFVEP